MRQHLKIRILPATRWLTQQQEEAEVAIMLDVVAGAEITPTNVDMINNAATSTMAINSAATSTMAMVPQITIPVG
jgi:3-oxoacyl-(acyl-carrier-protein) synthase